MCCTSLHCMYYFCLMHSPHLFLSSVEQFIRDKYERKLYISKDVPAVSPVTESKSEPAKGKVKESKKQSSSQKKDQVSVLYESHSLMVMV